MKLTSRFKAVLLSSVALLAFSGTIVAACLPNNCDELRDQCYADGGTGCENKYTKCLRSFGCPPV